MKDFHFLFRRIDDVITHELLRKLAPSASENAIVRRRNTLTGGHSRSNIHYIGQLLALRNYSDRRIAANNSGHNTHSRELSDVLHHVFKKHGFQAGELRYFKDILLPSELREGHIPKGYFYKSLDGSGDFIRDADPSKIAREHLQHVVKEKYGVEMNFEDPLWMTFGVSASEAREAGLAPEVLKRYSNDDSLQEAMKKFMLAWVDASQAGDQERLNILMNAITPLAPP